MPQILSQEKALRLDDLLKQVDTHGFEWSIHPSSRSLPMIQGLGALANATSSDISFIANPKLANLLFTTQAAAVVFPTSYLEQLPPQVPFTVVLAPDPYLFYSRIAQFFDQFRVNQLKTGIHPTAVIHPNAQLADGVSVGPHAVIEAHAVIGQGSIIGAGAYIGSHCQVGKHCIIYPNASLIYNVRMGDRCIIHSSAVLGADGFGFAPDSSIEPGGWSKISQLGGVLLGNDVEIGACSSVDRGALGDTVLGNDVKIDNQIMIGHNCEIGDHTAMAACVGVAGSTKVGKRCILGGASMIAGHITIVDDVQISAATPIMSSVLQPGRYTGVFPTEPHSDWQKNAAVMTQLSKLRRRLRELEKKVDKK